MAFCGSALQFMAFLTVRLERCAVRHVAQGVSTAALVSHALAVQGSQRAPCSPLTAAQIRPAHTTLACQQPCEFHTLRLTHTRLPSVLPHSLAFG